MSLQTAKKSAAAAHDLTQLEAEVPPDSAAAAPMKCALVPGRSLPRKEELPNPRRFAHLHLIEAIDSRNRDAAAVVQALVNVGITHVDHLLDTNVKLLFSRLDVTQDQLTAFVMSIEDAGVRFSRDNQPNS